MGNRIAKHIELLDGTRLSSTYYVLDAQGNPLAMYELDYAASSFELTERQIYGSARLGSLKTKVDVFGTAYSAYSDVITTHAIGDRNFELSNHLGNILSVVSDKLIPKFESSAPTIVSGYTADLLMSCDYSPFGVTLDGRGVEGSYRFGYQGSEKDDEVKGDGNSYTTMFRQLDPRVGRWLSIDPLAAQFPWQSPYVSMDNNPVALNDVTGLSTDGGEEGCTDCPEYVQKEVEIVFKKSDADAAKATNQVLNSGNNSGSAVNWIENIRNGNEDYSTAGLYRSYDSQSGMNTGPVTYQGQRMVNLIEHLAVIERRDSELYCATIEILSSCQTNEQFLSAYGLIESLSAQARLSTIILTADVIKEYAEFIASLYVGAILIPESVDYLVMSALSSSTSAYKNLTVLGHYPRYIKMANRLGANRFNIPTHIWKKMTEAEKWAANVKFLDRAIARGDAFRLATPLNKVKLGSYYQKEINYLLRQGYSLSKDGRFLIRG